MHQVRPTGIGTGQPFKGLLNTPHQNRHTTAHCRLCFRWAQKNHL